MDGTVWPLKLSIWWRWMGCDRESQRHLFLKRKNLFGLYIYIHTHTHIYIYIYIYILDKKEINPMACKYEKKTIFKWCIHLCMDNVSKVGDLSQGWHKGSLFNSYYTKSATPFLGLLHFTLYPYFIMVSVKQGSIEYHLFESLVWLDLGLNSGLPNHWQT